MTTSSGRVVPGILARKLLEVDRSMVLLIVQGCRQVTHGNGLEARNLGLGLQLLVVQPGHLEDGLAPSPG